MMADTLFSDRERHAEAAVPDLAPKGDWTEMPDLADYLTTQEAAKELGYNVIYVRSMIREGKLDGVKVGGKTWLVSKKSVKDYIENTSGMSKNDPRRRQN